MDHRKCEFWVTYQVADPQNKKIETIDFKKIKLCKKKNKRIINLYLIKQRKRKRLKISKVAAVVYQVADEFMNPKRK